MKATFLALLLLLASPTRAAEIALTFDDAPIHDTLHMKSIERTKRLIETLKNLKLPPVMIFATPCKAPNTAVAQLKLYRDAGHLIGNHTCSHKRLDLIGFESYSADALKADQMLTPLFSGQKYFRFPFLNEGKQVADRDRMREWLKIHHYKNGFVSIDTDDYLFSSKINKAKNQQKPIDYAKVKALFLENILSKVDFYDALAKRLLGRSPKHVILLHEMDATVLFIGDVIEMLRARGHTFIAADAAFKDPLYESAPKNNYSGDGLLAQLEVERTGVRIKNVSTGILEKKLDALLGL